LLAQTLEVFLAMKDEKAALDIARQRCRTWFDPDLVKAVQSPVDRIVCGRMQLAMRYPRPVSAWNLSFA